MKNRITHVRDMAVIEKELTAQKAGVLSFINQDEDLTQSVVPYLYLDKNVYFFFEESDETLLNINFEANVNFAVFDPKSSEKNSGYDFLQILFRGVIRKVEEVKYAEEVYKQFLSKYNAGSEVEESFLGIRAAFIDTEEIQAASISGS